MDITTFDQWVETLSSALDRARMIGMPTEEIKKSAVEMGNFLYQNVDPDVPENRLLREMWEVADDQSKSAIANTLIKLCDKHGKH